MTRIRVRNDRTRQYLAVANKEIEKAVAEGAIRVQREAQRLVGRFKGPPPSKPGTPPHIRTGTLRRSIDQETYRIPKGPNAFVFVGRIGSNLNYARIHELGGTINHPGGSPYIVIGGKAKWIKKATARGRDGVQYSKPHTIKMPPRPYLRPALASQIKKIRASIQAAALRARQKTGGVRRARRR